MLCLHPTLAPVRCPREEAMLSRGLVPVNRRGASGSRAPLQHAAARAFEIFPKMKIESIRIY